MKGIVITHGTYLDTFTYIYGTLNEKQQQHEHQYHPPQLAQQHLMTNLMLLLTQDEVLQETPLSHVLAPGFYQIVFINHHPPFCV